MPSQLIIYTSDTYKGSRAHSINADLYIGMKPGLHRLDITADRDWNAEITQHFWTQGDRIPVSNSGTGDGIFDPIMFEAGTIPVKATHNGSNNFAIEVNSLDGQDPD